MLPLSAQTASLRRDDPVTIRQYKHQQAFSSKKPQLSLHLLKISTKRRS
jgi:hypothetical protein